MEEYITGRKIFVIYIVDGILITLRAGRSEVRVAAGALYFPVTQKFIHP